MKNVRISDPAQNAFPSFWHNTTTYVGVPHGQPALLVIQSDEACFVSIRVSGEEIERFLVDSPSMEISLASLHPPRKPDSITRYLTAALPWHKQAPPLAAPSDGRLTAFTVVFLDPQQDTVAATFDFQILCPVKFEAARSCHLALRSRPDAIAPDTILERVEGTFCPECQPLKIALGSVE